MPTIQSAKFYEVQKFLVLTEHIITPRMIIANDAFWKGLPAADRTLLQAAFDDAVAWQDKELLAQETSLVDTLKGAGMTVINDHNEAFRKTILANVPAKLESKWARGLRTVSRRFVGRTERSFRRTPGRCAAASPKPSR